MADGVGHARRLRGRSSSTCGHGLLGALQRRRVGQLDADDEPALVLLRDEAGRGILEDPVGQDQQAAVDQQHDHAQAQRHADRPAVDRGHPVEERG